jgi:glycogen synthase
VRVLVLSNLYPPDVIGGYELCCRQMVEGLRGRGHEVTVLSTAPRQPCSPQPGVVRCFKFANCFESYGRQRDSQVLWALREAESRFVIAANIQLLLTALEQHRPDVVYVWNLLGLGGLAMIATLGHLGVPWVWHLEDCVPRWLCSVPGRPLPVVVAEHNRAVRGYYLSVSRRTVEEIEEIGIRLRDHVEFLPNWVIGARPAVRQRFYRSGTLRLVSAGQLSHIKGTELLIEAASLLLARGETRFHIDLYGPGQHARYQELILRQGVARHVSLRGDLQQEELWAHYARHEYDLFVFPTWAREPFGCAPLEAAAHGVVMLISERCGIAEWFVKGIHCLKTERTAAALADRVQDVLERRVDLEPLGRLGAATIWRDFHLDGALDRVERALEFVCSRPRAKQGNSESAYRLALLAERLSRTWVQTTHESSSNLDRR